MIGSKADEDKRRIVILARRKAALKQLTVRDIQAADLSEERKSELVKILERHQAREIERSARRQKHEPFPDTRPVEDADSPEAYRVRRHEWEEELGDIRDILGDKPSEKAHRRRDWSRHLRPENREKAEERRTEAEKDKERDEGMER